VAGIANCKKVFADCKMLAVLTVIITLNMTIYLATHENVRLGFPVCLDLLEAFIQPMDAVFAAKHDL
jgi:hypothetical protein